MPALILLDLMMPTMDGFEFLVELRRVEAWQSIPVVVLTSKDLTPGERDMLRGTVERVLQKGAYSRHALLKEVRKIVAQCARKPAGAADEPGSAGRAITAATSGDSTPESAAGVAVPGQPLPGERLPGESEAGKTLGDDTPAADVAGATPSVGPISGGDGTAPEGAAAPSSSGNAERS